MIDYGFPINRDLRYLTGEGAPTCVPDKSGLRSGFLIFDREGGFVVVFW